jgi:hypothetical protein
VKIVSHVKLAGAGFFDAKRSDAETTDDFSGPISESVGAIMASADHGEEDVTVDLAMITLP